MPDFELTDAIDAGHRRPRRRRRRADGAAPRRVAAACAGGAGTGGRAGLDARTGRDHAAGDRRRRLRSTATTSTTKSAKSSSRNSRKKSATSASCCRSGAQRRTTANACARSAACSTRSRAAAAWSAPRRWASSAGRSRTCSTACSTARVRPARRSSAWSTTPTPRCRSCTPRCAAKARSPPTSPAWKRIADRLAAGEEALYTPAAAPTVEPVVEAGRPTPSRRSSTDRRGRRWMPRSSQHADRRSRNRPTTAPMPLRAEPSRHAGLGRPGAAGDPRRRSQRPPGHHRAVAGRSAQARRARPTTALLRAIHTINGAFAMTEVPVITDDHRPDRGLRQAPAGLAAQPASAEGVAAMAAVAEAIRRTLAALQTPAPRVPAFEGAGRAHARAARQPAGCAPADAGRTGRCDRDRPSRRRVDRCEFAEFADDSPAADDLRRARSAAPSRRRGRDWPRPSRIEADAGERRCERAELPNAFAIERPSRRPSTSTRAGATAERRRSRRDLAPARGRGRTPRSRACAKPSAWKPNAREAERLEAERLAERRSRALEAERARSRTSRSRAPRSRARSKPNASKPSVPKPSASKPNASKPNALEAERAEAERVEAERARSRTRSKPNALEAERLEAERLEAERLEAERLEAERLEAERLEAERARSRARRSRPPRSRTPRRRTRRRRVRAHRSANDAGRSAGARANVAAAEAAQPIDARAASTPPSKPSTNRPSPRCSPHALAASDDPDEALDLTDLDPELVDIFVEEGGDLLDHSDGLLAQLREAPTDREPLVGLQRDLHTLKGGARMAGIMAVGELGHAMESLLEAVVEQRCELGRDGVPLLERGFDRLHAHGHPRRRAPRDRHAGRADRRVRRAARGEPDRCRHRRRAGEAAKPRAPRRAAPNASNSSRCRRRSATQPIGDEDDIGVRAPQEQVRIRADLLDRLVNYAGEVAIYRARLEQQLGAFRGAIARNGPDQHASARPAAPPRDRNRSADRRALPARSATAGEQAFDPLELDRFSTLQQLSRALAESAADLTSLQSTLDDLTRQYETLLLQQSRVSSELQEGLMRTRMVPFDALRAAPAPRRAPGRGRTGQAGPAQARRRAGRTRPQRARAHDRAAGAHAAQRGRARPGNAGQAPQGAASRKKARSASRCAAKVRKSCWKSATTAPAWTATRSAAAAIERGLMPRRRRAVRRATSTR